MFEKHLHFEHWLAFVMSFEVLLLPVFISPVHLLIAGDYSRRLLTFGFMFLAG